MSYNVATLVDTFYRFLELNEMNLGEAKLPDFLDDEDSGVPEAMFVGNPDEDGEVYWQTIPASLHELDFDVISKHIGYDLPLCLREFYSYKHIIKTDSIFLPSFPSDKPFSALTEQVSAWDVLLLAKYLPYVDYEDGRGPVCIDLNSGNLSRIIYFNADDLWAIGEEKCKSRELLSSKENLVNESFADLMTELNAKYQNLL